MYLRLCHIGERLLCVKRSRSGVRLVLRNACVSPHLRNAISGLPTLPECRVRGKDGRIQCEEY